MMFTSNNADANTNAPANANQGENRQASFVVTESSVVVTGTEYSGNAISVSQPIIVSSSVGVNTSVCVNDDDYDNPNNHRTNEVSTEFREGLMGKEVGEKTAARNPTLVTLLASLDVDDDDESVYADNKAEHHKIVATEVVANPLEVSQAPEPILQNAIILFDPRIPDCEQMIESAKRRGLFVTAVLPHPDKFINDGTGNALYYPNEEAVLRVGVHQVYTPPTGSKFDVIECAGHLQTIEIQQNIRFLGVIPFRESAVDYTDTLAALLGINIHNDLGLATARRDKGLMKNAVANAGLRTAKFARLTAANGSDMKEAIHELELEFPVVVKTPRGSSTAGVYICDTLEDATEKSILILKTPGNDGRKTHYSLLEEFLGGDEFAINIIASPTTPRGIFVTDVWKYAKVHENGTMINTMQSMCDPHSPKYAQLVRYAEGISRAVGIKYGLGHVEIKAEYDETRKRYVDPVMIEVGARLAGGRKAIMAQASIPDWRPFDALLDAHCGFPLQVPRRFTPLLHAKHVYIPCMKEGILKTVTGTDFERLETYHSHVALCEIGKHICKSRHIMSFPAFVWLVGNRESVERDAKLAREEFQVEVFPEEEKKEAT